ncbi:MAG: hypothetical protein H6724_13665 [Sandaracinus sp.]|nr:hypothetical protein [Sandaracinus sp.]
MNAPLGLAPDQLEALASVWREHPAAFCEDVLGFRPWGEPGDPNTQRALVEAVARPMGLNLSVRSGHKTGKANLLSTPVPTPAGWRTMGDIRVGDEVFDERGRPCRVVSTAEWDDRPVMRVTFEDGMHVDADEAHEWVVHTRKSRARGGDPVTLETRAMTEMLTVPNGKNPDGTPRRIANLTIDLAEPLDLPHADLPLDPYCLGVWLADGSKAGGEIAGIDDLHLAFVEQGFDVVARNVMSSCGKTMLHYVRGLRPVLRTIGVFDNKHVPDAYLWASAEQRLALLQGLMDADGTICARGRCDFTVKRRELADAVLHLARSLGIKARLATRRAVLNGVDHGEAYRVTWASPVPVFRLPRKLARIRTKWQQKANAHRRMAIVSIERLPGTHRTKCIEVDSPSHLYLCGDSMVPTHNSSSCAAIALWCWAHIPEVRVVLTAPTDPGISRVLWREVRRLYQRAPIPLGPPGWLSVSHHTGLRHPDGRQIFGMTTKTPEAFSGVSAPFVVYIVDEASGVGDDVFEAIHGNRAGGSLLILISNPTQPVGEFYASHHDLTDLYRTFHFDSSLVARTVNRDARLPGLATPGWVDEMVRRYGLDSARYDIRVRGNFPTSGLDTVITLLLVEAARQRWVETLYAPGQRVPPLVVGVDVARYGDDDSVAVDRRGHWLGMPERFPKGDGPDLGARVRKFVSERQTPGERGGVAGTVKPVVCIDTVGVGVSAYDWLRGNAPELEVVAFQGSERARESDRYHNARSEAYYAMRDWLREGGSLPPESRVTADLLGVRYKYDALGREQVESKDDIKKRLGRSPDFGDAGMLAVYARPSDEAPHAVRSLHLPNL